MLNVLIPLVAKTVVATSAGIAIDSAVKMIVPVGLKTIPAFSIKVGTAIATAIVSAKIGKLIETNVLSVIETVQSIEPEVSSTQEDN